MHFSFSHLHFPHTSFFLARFLQIAQNCCLVEEKRKNALVEDQAEAYKALSGDARCDNCEF